MLVHGVGQTGKGASREQNEDFMLINNDLGLYLVSDGMGWHACGEIASETTARTVSRYIQRHEQYLAKVKRGEEPYSSAIRIAEEAVREACREVHKIASTEEACARMGSTLTMLLFLGAKAVMVHVGDTRLYLYRNQLVHQLSSDHTIAAEIARAGIISPEESREHPHSHVLTRVIGRQSLVQIDALLLDLMPGDRFVLCSNGLSEYIEKADMLVPFMGGEFESIPGELVSFAKNSGGRDDVTVLAISVEPPFNQPRKSSAPKIRVESALDILGSVALFEDLSLAQLQRVLNASEVVEYRKGDTIVNQGQLSANLYILIQGRIAMTRDGRPIAEMVGGDYIGETTLIDERACRSTLRVLEDTRLLVLSKERFQNLVRRHPWLGVTLLKRLGQTACAALARYRQGRGDQDSSLPLDELF